MVDQLLQKSGPAVQLESSAQTKGERTRERIMLANPVDDHSLLVFDEKIRGKTDRFVFKFRKPR